MNGDKGRRGPRPVKSSKLAEWLWDQLQGGKDVPIVDLVDRARDAGLLPMPTEKEGKASISPLYAAQRRIAELHQGWDIVQADTETGLGALRKVRKAWRLVRIDGDQAEDKGGIRIDDGGPPY
jgi:hypothetical protein